MKRMTMAAALLLALAVFLIGCVGPLPLVIDAEWCPRVHPEAKRWALLVTVQAPGANAELPHTWSADWGDGTTEQWANGERNWPNYPLDNSRFAGIHEYTESGDYVATVTLDDWISAAVRFSVDVGR